MTGVAFRRTPEDRFEGLPDWPYAPRYVDVDDLRMAYVDEGGADGRTILLVHGEPTWGYLYRRMLPGLLAAGHRVVVPDLIGFGRSDKPVDRDAYSYAGHVRWLASFVEHLDLDDIVLFCQDWGGLLGLRVAAEHPDRFDRLVIANTALPDGVPMGDGFMLWQRASQEMPFLDCGALLQRATLARTLTEAEVDAYRAPFPDETYMAGARQFPLLVPTGPDDPAVPANRAAWEVLERWDRPVLTLWAPDDLVLGRLQDTFVRRIPGASGQPHRTFSPAGHFLQDDCGEQLAEAIVGWLAVSPARERGDPVRVVPARLDWLEALAAGDDVFTSRFDVPVAAGWVGFPEALPLAVDGARKRSEDPWGSHLFFDDADGALVGFGGFKGAPRDGEVEVGYAIAPSRQGRGLATAVVDLLVARAGAAGVRTVTAHTLGEENPSTAVLRKNGFVRAGEIDDPDEGTVWRWELNVASRPTRPAADTHM